MYFSWTFVETQQEQVSEQITLIYDLAVCDVLLDWGA